MKNEDSSFNLLRDYLGFDARTFAIFVALVVGVFVVVTGAYVSIFGLDAWKTNMQRAGSMMVINFQQPATGVAPELPQAEDPLAPAAPRTWPAATGGAVQYTCPNCGATALPLRSQNGSPVCPHCHAVIGANNPSGGQPQAASPRLSI